MFKKLEFPAKAEFRVKQYSHDDLHYDYTMYHVSYGQTIELPG